MKWFIKSGDLYWSERRGDWGSKERATEYEVIVSMPMPIAWDPKWVQEQALAERYKAA